MNNMISHAKRIWSIIINPFFKKTEGLLTIFFVVDQCSNTTD